MRRVVLVARTLGFCVRDESVRRECVKWLREVGSGLYSVASWAKGFRVGFSVTRPKRPKSLVHSRPFWVSSRVEVSVYIYNTYTYIYTYTSANRHITHNNK